jgi:alpha-amylase
VVLEQLAAASPETLRSFQALAATGQVEFLGETYYHSLSFLYSPAEFRQQVRLHRALVRRFFKQTPRAFRHTELIYNNELAREVARLGFGAIIAEGADHILGGRSPNVVYRPAGLSAQAGTPKIKLLLKDYVLADDMAFRFTRRDSAHFPLTAAKFAAKLAARRGELINLFLDYETFGEHHWIESGIFDFLRDLPREVKRQGQNDFVTVSEAAARYPARDEIDAPRFYSWADTERDLSAWLDNPLQLAAAQRIYELEPAVLASGKKELISAWRRLQTSDHLYYMCTKWWQDGDVHKYFSPYRSPYEAFVSVMEALDDLRSRVIKPKLTTHV